ncbi:D-TA family PLP-dependent enzyme [Daejeonella sp.]|uniref:D-TA family PLP-dependent enzyme n=1 Tax=Daejeonella sp. TaxID=2805397 RepID=UPI003982E49F
MEWYTIKNEEKIDSPALLVYKACVLDNIRKVLTMVKNPEQLRPHVKTHKITEVCTMMLASGIKKFKAATIAEAEMLGMSGAKDVILAYQPVKPKFLRFLKLISKYPDTKYSCLIDNFESAALFSDLFSASDEVKNGTRMPVFIDLNVGMDRTGINPVKAYDLYREIQKLSGIEFKGFHAYDGHIRVSNLDERIAQCDRDFYEVERLRRKIMQEENELPLLVAGGTPTFSIHSIKDNVECSPGTFVFWDKGYHDSLPEQDFQYAALILTRVVSIPDENKICIDLGYKALASENELQNRVYFLNHPSLKPLSHSEEHMVVSVDKVHGFKIGEILYALPVHICPTVALYESVFVVEDAESSYSTWDVVARDRMVTC